MNSHHSTATTTELLAGLHQTDGQAWELFDQRYRPILVGFLRKMGLRDADAADTAQETLAKFVQDYRRGMYDREQGRLRTWLIAIARYRLADLRRDRARRGVGRGDSVLQQLPDRDQQESIWDTEQRQVIFRQAMQELQTTGKFQPRTLTAFERVVLRGEPVQQVSEELGLAPQEIYNAKNRVAARLREILACYEDPFCEG